MKRGLGAALVVVVLSGCASSTPPQPSVYAYPTKGQSAEQQARDANECQTWAVQQTGYNPTTDTAKGAGIGAAIGAITGAAAGAAIGAAVGAPGTGAAIGAATGGIGGAGVGGGLAYAKNKEGYEKAYGACMQGRGYSVK